MNSKVVLVTGATGKTGGAVVRHLLEGGWKVRALTRDPNKDAAQALEKQGAELAKGDLDDRKSVDQALGSVYGVFSFPNMASGIEAEDRQGKMVADAALAAGVQHFVQSTVGGAERESGIPHFESKRRIEEHIDSLRLPATLLRPAYFMENLNWKRAQILDGTYVSIGMNPDKGLQMIAADDIGAFAALVFDNPKEYIGSAIELAGDELTESQMVATLAKVIGRSVNLASTKDAPRYDDMDVMIRWFNESGYAADIPALRARMPTLLNFEGWLRRNGWENAGTGAAEPG